MTRDTKVGIVVSCSFLCLVGVVLVNKMREPNGRGEQTNPPGQAQKEETPLVEKKPEEKQSPESKAAPETPAAVAAATPVERAVTPEPSSVLPEKVPPSTPTPSDPPAVVPPVVAVPAPEKPVTTPPEKPDKTPVKKKPEEDKPVAVASSDEKESPPPSTPTVVPVPAPEVAPPAVPAVPPTAADVKQPEPPAAPEKVGDEKKTEVPSPNITPVPVPLPPAAPPVEAVVPKPEVELKPATPTPVTTEVVTPVPVVEGPTKVGEEKPKKSGDTAGSEKPERVLPSPAEAGVTPPPPSPGDVKSLDGGPPPVKEERLVPLPASDVVKPEASSPRESTPAVPEPPREDARIAPVVARTDAPRPAVGGLPDVDSFGEEEYTVQPGDTYATVSKKKYFSEKYAEALGMYNRNDSLLGDPGKDLRAGQVLSVPDLRILEKRYGNLIPGTKPMTAPGPDAGERKIVPVSAVSPPGGEGGPSGVAYRVPPQGQTMREIARLTLGDGERWGEVYRLNRQHRPDFAVPGGTVLQLPADARIEPASQSR